MKSSISQREVDKMAHDTRQRHRKQLDKLLGEYTLGNLKYQVHLLKGKAETLIPELAKRKQIGHIIMGTFCRTWITGYFIGKTAEMVLQQVGCSVLTVKPDRIVRPVIMEVKTHEYSTNFIISRVERTTSTKILSSQMS